VIRACRLWFVAKCRSRDASSEGPDVILKQLEIRRCIAIPRGESGKGAALRLGFAAPKRIRL